MSLIVTGSIGIDTIDAPTGKAENVLGGSAIYFAASASLFGPVRLVAAVGDDFPPAMLKAFQHFKVDLAGLEQRTGSKTFRWHGKYQANMNQRDTIDVKLNVLGEKLPPVPGHYRDSRFVFLANTHPAGQMELLAQFPQHKLVVADTMDLWINHELPTLKKLLKKIDGLVLNDAEATMLTGESNPVKAGQQVLKMGPGHRGDRGFVVVKKGEHGSLLLHKQGVVALPAYPAVKVIDPTGAGDSFAGGMMGYLAGTGKFDLKHLRQAMAYGTVVASFTIEAFSLTRLRKLTRAELTERYRQYVSMLRVEAKG